MPKVVDREKLIVEMKQALVDYWAKDDGEYTTPYGRRPTWLYTKSGGMFIRDGFHNVDGTLTRCFDFANLNLKPQYEGYGIMLEVMEWWHLQHNRACTFVECVHNPAFEARLARDGWIKDSNKWDTHYYKLTGHPNQVDF